MIGSKTIRIRTLGPVYFTDSLRAKRLSITIKPDQTIRVSIPKGVSLAKAKTFLRCKIPWVKKHLNRLRELRQDDAQPTGPAMNRDKARTILAARLAYLARQHGFRYNKVFIRNQKTRWGTCSSKNNISLNIQLMRLPQELQDYVILHELVHTRHKNHSKMFWAEMDKLVGDAKKLRKEMRKFRLGTV